MKLNLGCGYDIREGYVNVDKFSPEANVRWDLEVLPWPWKDNSADEIVLKHVLEHLGQATELYLNIIKEIYRVAAPNALIHIEVPYPFHPHYIGDATHCRPVTALGLQMFNLDYSNHLIAEKSIATPLAVYTQVDFVMLENIEFWDRELNIIQYSKILLKAIKPFRGTPDTKQKGDNEISICVYGPGIGDVSMGLCTAHSLADAGYEVTMVAQPEFHEYIRACPHVKYATSTQTEDEIWLTAAWYHFNPAHQVDTFNKVCGVPDAPDSVKSLDINITQEISDGMRLKYPGTNRVVIHPMGRDPGKTWPNEYWQLLTDKLLSAGIEVISIGVDGWLGAPAVAPAGSISEFNLSPFETIALLRQSKLLISACSGPIQLAGAAECGILGLYSLMPSETRLPYRHGEKGWNAAGVMTSCPHAPCFRKLIQDEPEFEWSVEVQQMWNTKTLGQIMAEWCPNKEAPYSCMKAISVDEVYIKAIEMYSAQDTLYE